MNRLVIAPAARIALIGTGQVARALAVAIDRRASRLGSTGLRLAWLCNSRGQARPEAPEWRGAVDRLDRTERSQRTDPSPELADGLDVVIDLSASDAVAARHAEWLARGMAVVTANKRGLGESAARADAILAAGRAGGEYGDSATVGAGLGGVRRLRELHACGEPVHAIAGVLSGTLAWLFDRYDSRRPFSELVREAHAQGYTEPDPREDIAGHDVARKLRILARAVGWPVPDGSVEIDPRLRCPEGPEPWAAIVSLNAGIDELFRQRPDPSARPAVVARACPERRVIGLEWLVPDDPLAQRSGCDNAIVIHSERYRERPLVLRGPGAGPELTAAAVLDDVLAVLQGRRQRSAWAA